MRYTEAILYISRLNDLRVIARSLGVQAPTTKKKAQLIKEIIEAQNGTLKVELSKRGRKPLSRFVDFNNTKCTVCQIHNMQLLNDLNKLHNEYMEKVNQLFNEFKRKLNDNI